MEIFTRLLVLLSKLEEKGQLSALLAGIVIGFAAGFGLNRLVRKALFTKLRVENAELRGRNEQQSHLLNDKDGRIATLARESEVSHRETQGLNGQLAERRAKSEELSAACEVLRDKQQTQRRRVKQLRRRLMATDSQVDALTQQLNGLTNSDGKIWNRKAMGEVAPFVPLSLRRTPIISVVNLKGGVGKTTITANLGATLGALGRRVLLVDLDHQGSLTSLCLSHAEAGDTLQGGRFVQDIFRDDAREGVAALQRCATRLQEPGVGHVFLVAANDAFVDVETQLMERWLSRAIRDDVRYRLRRILHDPEVYEKFDVILLDCPPRLTTGGVNALAASDFMLIPVLPEDRTTEAVPRLLKSIKSMRPKTCPDLALLGVVGNKVKYHSGKIVSNENDILKNLESECLKIWDVPVHHFQPMRIHNRVTRKFAAHDPKFQAVYRDLVEEILKDLPSHARCRTATVPPVLDRSLEGVGS